MPRDSVWYRARSDTGRPPIPHFLNIVVDAVVQVVLGVVCSPQEAQHGMAWAAG